MKRLLVALLLLWPCVAVAQDSCKVLLLRNDQEGHERLMYKRGDPILVRPWDWVWGRMERPEAGLFWEVKLIGVNWLRLQEYLEAPEWDDTKPDSLIGVRAWRTQTAQFAGPLIDSLNAHGTITLNYAMIRPFLRHHGTGQSMPLDPR